MLSLILCSDLIGHTLRKKFIAQRQLKVEEQRTILRLTGKNENLYTVREPTDEWHKQYASKHNNTGNNEWDRLCLTDLINRSAPGK